MKEWPITSIDEGGAKKFFVWTTDMEAVMYLAWVYRLDRLPEKDTIVTTSTGVKVMWFHDNPDNFDTKRDYRPYWATKAIN